MVASCAARRRASERCCSVSHAPDSDARRTPIPALEYRPLELLAKVPGFLEPHLQQQRFLPPPSLGCLFAITFASTTFSYRVLGAVFLGVGVNLWTVVLAHVANCSGCNATS